MDSPGPKGRGLSRPSRGLETSGWEQIPPLALGGCSPPPFAGLLCTQRSPRLWKLLPCCGVYWILGSLRSSATDKCSRMAQHTLDPVTSSGQKLQHGGPPEVDAETEFIETPLSMSGWTLSPTASHGHQSKRVTLVLPLVLRIVLPVRATRLGPLVCREIPLHLLAQRKVLTGTF
ncbi:uncharacterized protein [Equus caballus]|uniref:uncharacterized protein isoform X3 n=1 Tax=Equus caballus TaxID=9796 RepID=UPI0038B40F39